MVGCVCTHWARKASRNEGSMTNWVYPLQFYIDYVKDGMHVEHAELKCVVHVSVIE